MASRCLDIVAGGSCALWNGDVLANNYDKFSTKRELYQIEIVAFRDGHVHALHKLLRQEGRTYKVNLCREYRKKPNPSRSVIRQSNSLSTVTLHTPS